MVFKQTKQAYRKVSMVFAMLAIFGSAFVIPTQVTNAADTGPEYTLLQPLPCIPSETKKCEAAQPGKFAISEKLNFQDYFQNAFNLMIALAAVAAVFMIVYGGFQYVISDAAGTKNEGLKHFKNALWGLGLVLGAYLILKTINPRLVTFPSTIKPILDKDDKRLRTSANLYQEVLRESALYQADTTEILKKAKEADTSIDSIYEEQADLQAEANAITDDPEAKVRILNQIAANNDKIAALKDDVTLASTKSSLKTYYNQTQNEIYALQNKIGLSNLPLTQRVYENIDASVQSARDGLSAQRTITDPKLSTEGKQQLSEYLIAMDNKISVLGVQAKIDTANLDHWYMPYANQRKSEMIATLDAAEKNLKQVSDSAVRQEVQNKIDKARIDLKNAKILK